MRINILTLFPNMFNSFLDESIIKRAIDNKKVEINIKNLRDYTSDKHKHVDDTPYGGGHGMVLKCEPVFNAINELKKDNTKVIMLSPQGIPFTQRLAKSLAKEEDLLFICGHYEGFDERISSICDMELSIGDYVLTGGELPSMVITDSITRLLPGVIEEESHEKESFEDNLLDYPTYTKPREFNGMKVPDVLLSGDHKKIDEWRKAEAIRATKEKRPDLLVKEIKENEYVKGNKEERKVIKIGKYALIDDKSVKKDVIFNITNQFNFMPKKEVNRKELSSVSKVAISEPTFIESLAKNNINKKLNILLKQVKIVLDDETDDEGTAYVLGELDRLESMLLHNYAKYLDIDYVSLIQNKIDLLRNEINLKQMMKVETIEYKGRHR